MRSNSLKIDYFGKQGGSIVVEPPGISPRDEKL